MIKLVNVEKAYESGAGKTWVLRRINLDIAEGDFITIMGPSGAGKSTLMGIVGMLDGAWKGEYYLLENPVHKLDNLMFPSRSFSNRVAKRNSCRRTPNSMHLCVELILR